jgi:hypothetical protein
MRDPSDVGARCVHHDRVVGDLGLRGAICSLNWTYHPPACRTLTKKEILMSTWTRRASAFVLALVLACSGVALASPASAAITIAYTIVPTLGTITTLPASIGPNVDTPPNVIACGSNVVSCTVTMTTTVNKCEDMTALTGLDTSKTYDGTVSPKILSFSLGSFSVKGATATYNKTSLSYRTCTTGTTSMSCTVAGGKTTYLKTAIMYKNYQQAVKMEWVNPLIGTFKTINDYVYIRKPYSTSTTCA